MKEEEITIKMPGLEFPIRILRVDSHTINIPIPKAIPKNSFLSGSEEYRMNILETEFFEDLGHQIPPSLNGDLMDIAFESLFTVISHHIRRHGRLLPQDLDTYIAENILLFSGISTATNKGKLERKHAEDIFITFYNGIVQILPDGLKTPFLISGFNG